MGVDDRRRRCRSSTPGPRERSPTGEAGECRGRPWRLREAPPADRLLCFAIRAPRGPRSVPYPPLTLAGHRLVLRSSSVRKGACVTLPGQAMSLEPGLTPKTSNATARGRMTVGNVRTTAHPSSGAALARRPIRNRRDRVGQKGGGSGEHSAERCCVRRLCVDATARRRRRPRSRAGPDDAPTERLARAEPVAEEQK